MNDVVHVRKSFGWCLASKRLLRTISSRKKYKYSKIITHAFFRRILASAEAAKLTGDMEDIDLNASLSTCLLPGERKGIEFELSKCIFFQKEERKYITNFINKTKKNS